MESNGKSASKNKHQYKRYDTPALEEMQNNCENQENILSKPSGKENSARRKKSDRRE